VVAQALNYPSHAQDVGVGEDPPPVLLRKSSALKARDVVTASIATGDGALDLGAQRVVVRDPG
jgi:hypothetical protein